MRIYAALKKSKWLSGDEFDVHEPALSSMPFHTFALLFTVGERGSHRNKIKGRAKQNIVLVFYPKYSPNPRSPNYTEYCRFAMLKYVPWAGKDPSTLWGGQDASDDDIHEAWANHLTSFERDSLPVPDFIRKEVDEYYSNPENVEEPNLEPDIDTEELEPTDFAFRDEEVNINLDDEELTDPDEVDIQWHRNHDWSEPEHDYDEEMDLETVSQQYQNIIDDFVVTVQAAADDDIPLNELQQLGREMLINLVDATEEDEKLGIFVGRGGTGKSTTINAAVRTLEER